MSLFVAKKLVLYRSGIVAVINAPLGLFSVILCTVGVFISSLAAGWVCDVLRQAALRLRSLLKLLEDNYRDVMSASRESQNIDVASYVDLPTPEQRNQG